MLDIFLFAVLPTLIAWLLLVISIKQDIRKGEVYDKSEADSVIFVLVISCIPGISFVVMVLLLGCVIYSADISESLANWVNEKSKVYRERS